MTKITSVRAREIIDSRGNPTIEVLCELSGGTIARASVPSGASTGVHEAIELRDKDPKRFNGLGVQVAVGNVNDEINRHIHEKEFDQQSLDTSLRELDGTENKSRLGANAILGVSLAFARASAKEKKVELYEHLGSLAGTRAFKLPQPMFNIINGGKHATSGLDIQEYMVVPIGFPTARENIRVVAEIIPTLKKLLAEKGYATAVGDEGGFAPKLSSNEEAFELIGQAIVSAGYTAESVKIGIDVAASSFYNGTSYHLKIDGKASNLDRTEMVEWYEKLVATYPIISIEDGHAEEDWDGFGKMLSVLGQKIKIVGDDLTVTNSRRIQTAIEKNAVNSVIIKPNQIGTLTETLEAIALTKKQGWLPIISHRSGDTTDTFIADLAVGLSCDYIKSGSLVRGERVCKYNRLMEIGDTLNLA
ncbi:MAG: phosphopyruvate hydratase [bacterium]|nr:phosphopyruvate hydratase [bacterium]